METEPNITQANKQLIRDIFTELEKGNDLPFLEAMAEDMKWTWMGSNQWSRTFDGKTAVVNELWTAVRTTLKPPYKMETKRIIADQDYVVVEAQGSNNTPDGKAYDNKYCWVIRIEKGKLTALNEYMDTDLVTRTFQKPIM